MSTVPFLVLFSGGDALSVCFNTLAILFLCDIDNIAYDHGLSGRVRTRVEERSRVDLSDQEAVALMTAKEVHISLIVLLVPFTVWCQNLNVATFLPFLAFWIGKIVEAIGKGGGAAAVGNGVCKATGDEALGLVGFGIMMVSINYV